jgi:hypothetical protein
MDDELRAFLEQMEARMQEQNAAAHAETRHFLRTEIKETAADLRGEIKETAAELRSEMKETAIGLRTEMKETAADSRHQFGVMLEDFRGQIVGRTVDALSAEIQRVEARLDDRTSGLDYRLTRLEMRKR